MGRIDEALRRSRNNIALATPTAGGSVTGDVFVSPWSFGDQAAASDNPASQPVAERVREGAPAAEAFPGTELRTIRGFRGAWTDRLVTAQRPDAVLVEQFRQLAATLLHARSENNVKVVMVTSAGPHEGKSFTAINLSLTLSESYRMRVLLIDADLRRPSLHEVAGVPNASGLGDTLKSAVEQKLAVYQITDTLMLVPAGKPDPDPMSALTSPRMRQILTEAAARFDWVLIDAPPVGPIVDSSLLAENIDAAIMVVRAGQTQYADVQRAVECVGRDRILGVVLNGVEEARRPEYRRYYEHPADHGER